MAQVTAEQKQKPAYRVKGTPVKLGKATLQRRADPLTHATCAQGKAKDGGTLGGILLNGEHTFLETMPDASWFRVRTTPKGKRQVFLVFRCTGLKPIEFGPFPNEARALWMLDRIYNEMGEYLIGWEGYDKGPWATYGTRERKSSDFLSLVE